MKTKFWLIVIIIVLAIIAVAIFVSSKKLHQNQTIKIGVILPLSGNMASLGDDIKDGIVLANEKTALSGLKIDLLLEDEKCDPKEAINAYNSTAIKGAKIIIGPVCSQSTLAIAPLAEKAKMIILTPASAADSISQAGDYIFRNHILESTEQKKMAEFVAQKYKTAATIFDQSSDAYVIGEKTFTDSFQKDGGVIVERQSYQKNSTDFRSQLIKIKEKNPQVVYVGALMPEVALIIKQIKEMGINAQIISDNTVTDSKFLSAVGPLAEGIIFAASDFKRETNQEFWDLYKNRFGKDPNIFAAQGYDSLIILAKIIKESCPTVDSTCIKDGLYKIKDYSGVSGSTTFDSNGDAIKPIVIKIIKDGQFVLY
ncbi:MAG: penicillin-binding protein activator [Patescibacteria group bacterium]